MKKNRPGVTVRALVDLPRVSDIGRMLFRETTTLGYRYWPVARETLEREEAEVQTSWGVVAIKRVRRWDGKWEVRPEYDACRRLAQTRGVPLRDVMASLAAELNRPDGTEG